VGAEYSLTAVTCTFAGFRVLWCHRIVPPRTLLTWHQRFRQGEVNSDPSPGRPPLTDDLRELITRLGSENPRRGFRRVHGELRRLGHLWGARTRLRGLTWPFRRLVRTR
jgi:hypothetical protein